jgi:hypothetical protein
MTQTLETGQTDVAGQICPSWCVNAGTGLDHAHVSADLIGGTPEQPLVARLIGMQHDDQVRVLLNDRVTSIDQLDQFVSGLRRLVDGVRLAEAGLGFVASLAARADVTLEDLAQAAGVPEHRVAAQDEGQQVLTVHEYDRLALAAASLVAAARTVA